MGSPVALVSSDRATIVGASGTGKSTLSNHLLKEFRADYPDARIMVCDTKPRWRGERLPDGRHARHLYKDFVKGDTISNAMVLSDPRDWSLAWHKDTNPSQTVVVQRLSGEDAVNLKFQLWAIRRFFYSTKASRPSLLYIDEGMDFFTVSGYPVGGSDIIQRCYRAGREKGLTTLLGVQRPKNINMQLLTEMSYCALFRIDYEDDVKRLRDMGWPKDVPAPTYAPDGGETYAFRLKRSSKGPVAPAYRIVP